MGHPLLRVSKALRAPRAGRNDPDLVIMFGSIIIGYDLRGVVWLATSFDIELLSCLKKQ